MMASRTAAIYLEVPEPANGNRAVSVMQATFSQRTQVPADTFEAL